MIEEIITMKMMVSEFFQKVQENFQLESEIKL